MILEFLNKYQEELINKKIELEEDYEMIISKKKENEMFLSMLLDEKNSVFSDFSPREHDFKNKNRMNEIYQILEELENRRIILEQEIHSYKKKIKELNSIFEEMQSSNNEKSGYYNIKKELENVLNYILIDPMRAKIQIEDIIRRIEKDE